MKGWELEAMLCAQRNDVWVKPGKDGAKWEPPPRVFCERVRNRLMAKGLGKRSFLKSVEEYENRGANFVRFVAKSEKSEGAEIGLAPLVMMGMGDDPDLKALHGNPRFAELVAYAKRQTGTTSK